MGHISEDTLLARLEKARHMIDFDTHYFHWKSPDKFYIIKDLALLEADEEPGVVYRAQYGRRLTWVRAISDFFSEQEKEDGKKTVKFKPIKLAACVIIENDKSEVLLGKRGKKSKNQVGKWESTGGRVELGESFEETAVRESKEERGVDIKLEKVLYSTPFCEAEEQLNWYYKVFLGRINSGSELNWFSKDE